MEPTWQSGDVQLYLGDCLEVLPTLEAGSVDAVITDPPYANLSGGIVMSKRCGGVAEPKVMTTTIGDLWKADFAWCSDAWRIARLSVMVFSGHKAVAETRQAFPDAKVQALLTWHKRNSSPVLRNVPKFTTEFVWLLEKEPGLSWADFKSTWFDIPMLQAGCFASERILKDDSLAAVHPAQKPVLLMSHLLIDGIKSVLDPFVGTGTTGVACVKTGRRFIGIEINPGYFEIAKKRIMETQMQPRLEGM